jgi:aspartate aminotransferase
MTILSDRIENLGESATIAMSQMSRDLAAKGVDVINLSLGEPDFNTPDFIKSAAKKAINENYSQYTPVPGLLEVRKSIALKLKRDNGIDYTPEQIVISTGAKQSIINTVLCLVNKGDEVLIPAPYWVSYREMALYSEGTVVPIKAEVEQGFKINPEQLEAHITEKTKLFIFSSPSNPTGGGYTETELRALGEVFKRHPKIHIISDEIYEHIRYIGSHFSIASISDLYERVITVNGVSKAFAMTGWRIGYIAASKKIAQACTKIQGQFTSAPSSISQIATKAAMEADPSEIKFMKEAFSVRRSIMIEGLSAIPGLIVNEPEGAFYLFPKVSTLFGSSFGNRKIENALDLCMYLLEEAHVATVDGAAFGADEYIRISYATSDEILKEAIRRISNAISKLVK